MNTLDDNTSPASAKKSSLSSLEESLQQLKSENDFLSGLDTRLSAQEKTLKSFATDLDHLGSVLSGLEAILKSQTTAFAECKALQEQSLNILHRMPTTETLHALEQRLKLIQQLMPNGSGILRSQSTPPLASGATQEPRRPA